MAGSRTTHCKRGHKRTAENTYVQPNGVRMCRVCANHRRRLWRKQNAARMRAVAQTRRDRNRERLRAYNREYARARRARKKAERDVVR